MLSEQRARMANVRRPVLLALSFSISSVPLLASADRHGGGGGGGGGRLGQVSSGLGAATGGFGNGGGGAPSPSPGMDPHVYRDHRYDGVAYVEPVYLPSVGGAVATGPTRPSPPVSVDFYAGAQKVYESDGSLSLELAFNEGRFRFGGTLSRYFERQEGDPALTLTLGTLYIGWRIDDGGPTRAYLEFGAVGAETRHDPVIDSSVGGLLGGVRVEHRTSRLVSWIGDAQAMAFEDDVRAGAIRAGLRIGHVQATLRYFDFNVGPALYGPEVGLRF
jgi:hypothetical protein